MSKGRLLASTSVTTAILLAGGVTPFHPDSSIMGAGGGLYEISLEIDFIVVSGRGE